MHSSCTNVADQRYRIVADRCPSPSSRASSSRCCSSAAARSCGSARHRPRSAPSASRPPSSCVSLGLYLLSADSRVNLQPVLARIYPWAQTATPTLRGWRRSGTRVTWPCTSRERPPCHAPLPSAALGACSPCWPTPQWRSTAIDGARRLLIMASVVVCCAQREHGHRAELLGARR